jgi:hypothetical protein
LRAWFTKRFAISISAYLSQMETERWWWSSARSQTLRARAKSFWLSSHFAYFTQTLSFQYTRRIKSSYSLRFFRRYSASSSTSAIFNAGALKSSSWCSFASRTICSAVICERGGRVVVREAAVDFLRRWMGQRASIIAGGETRSRRGRREISKRREENARRAAARGRTCVGAGVLFFTRVGRGYFTAVAP